ncbi:MAG: thioesterase family protein [Desulfobacter sp.]|nr:thioesterase family protein [Desulfobacter sp.]WDP88189.1 MAG: thioesterase family protein [Desulfobacter sp.]
MFEAKFYARWADMDFNGHMKNTAFLDYAADCRMLFFKSKGFPMATFAKLRIGPVVFSDTIRYFKELFMYEPFYVRFLLQEINLEGSRFSIVNEICQMDGTLAALVESKSCWLDLDTRKIISPPDDLHAIVKNLGKTMDFKEN